MIALLLMAELSSSAIRTTTYSNPAEDINLTHVEAVTRDITPVKGEPTTWQIKERRTFKYSLVGNEKVPGDFKPVESIYKFQPSDKPQAGPSIDPVNTRLARIYTGLITRRDLSFSAQEGGVVEGKVNVNLKKLTFTYEDAQFKATGTLAYDPKTRLPLTWKMTATNVPIPGGDSKADLIVEEKPA